MNIKQHANPQAPNRTACAPYNFVPLPAVDVVARAIENAGGLPDHNTYADPDFPYTGYFDVTLTTRSPLYIRGLLKRQQFEWDAENKDRHGKEITNQTSYQDRVKNTPEFFHTRDASHPVIPGSSLRGMLRSLLEIVSYSKFNAVADKHLIYRAVGDTTSLGIWYRDQTLGPNQVPSPTSNMLFDYPIGRLQGGYLHHDRDGWAIRPSKRHDGTCFVSAGGETFVHVEYAEAARIGIGQNGQRTHPIYVQPAVRSISSRSNPNLSLNLAMAAAIAQRDDAHPKK